jgi:hypothetical protein
MPLNININIRPENQPLPHAKGPPQSQSHRKTSLSTTFQKPKFTLI